jgi:glycerol-3-phosphate dehydrogenase (NAD(P)+)
MADFSSLVLSTPPVVGVIGAGSFGMTVANLLAANRSVILYAHRAEVVQELRATRHYCGRRLRDQILITQSPQELAEQCEIIFPVIPSKNFRGMLRDFAPYLRPYHKLIHATKGLDVDLPEDAAWDQLPPLRRDQVRTMSELVLAETAVLRVGAMSGPNLAQEIAEEQPAATVIASRFDEVIREGQAALRSQHFRVHDTHDLIGAELAGVLKNIIAIAGGIVGGLEFGDNTRGLLITRGLAEMIHIGQHLGAEVKPFLGLAGIGDLIATCYSPNSRNFTVGYRLAKGETLNTILADMEEVAEGVKTVAIVRALSQSYKFSAPITQTLYKILFEGQSIERSFTVLMELPFTEDVTFI